MTDTPRTVAQIKALLANNSTGNISEQDMRDLVESLTNPAPGSGFVEPMWNRMLAWNRYYASGWLTIPAGSSGNSSATPVVSINPNGTPAAYNYLYDVAEWWSPTYSLAAADPTNSYGVEVAAGDAVLLPPGMFYASTYVQLVTALDPATQWAEVFWDQVTHNPNFDYGSITYPNKATGPWMHDGYFSPIGAGSPTGTPQPNFIPNTPARYNGAGWPSASWLFNDSTEPQPYIMLAMTRSDASPALIQYIATNIVQVAGASW